MFQNIRWRIAFPYVLLILLVMMFMVFYLSAIVRESYLEGMRVDLLADARLVRDALSATMPEESVAASLDPAAYRYARLLDERVTLIGADGAVLGESHESQVESGNRLNRPEVRAAISDGEGTDVRPSRTMGYDTMYAAVSVEMEGGEVGVVRVARPLTEVNEQIERLRRAMILAAVIATAMAGLLAVVIAEQTAKPVRQLTEVARRMAEGDLHARMLFATRDEVGLLSRAFNYMADQLREKMTTLSSERSRLAAVLDSMAGGVIIADREGRVSLINPAAARLLETTSGQALGLSFALVVRHHQLIELWQTCREQGSEQSTAVEISRRGLFLQAIARPFPQHRFPTLEGFERGDLETWGHTTVTAIRPGGVLVILQDLTRIRRLETVRRDFISNISHELRTPLAGLKALVDTLRGGAMDDPPAATRFLDRMDSEVDTLTQMLEELLELSRIESGRMPLRLRPIEVAEVIHSPVERLLPQAERAGLAVHVELDPDLPQVLAEKERVQRVVTNLVHNAIKFTPAGGRVDLGAQVDGDKVRISVRDTGVGVLPDDLTRIFERFYKVDRARSGGGTGLGLSISKHIVQAHGGQIWAESPANKHASQYPGSIFYFTLPISPQSQE